ncbi:MAG: hypothetical protein ACLUQ6_09085 [Alistipes onderdonkii]
MVGDSIRTKDILLSRSLADRLMLGVGDRVEMLFVEAGDSAAPRPVQGGGDLLVGDGRDGQHGHPDRPAQRAAPLGLGGRTRFRDTRSLPTIWPGRTISPAGWGIRSSTTRTTPRRTWLSRA